MLLLLVSMICIGTVTSFGRVSVPGMAITAARRSSSRSQQQQQQLALHAVRGGFSRTRGSIQMGNIQQGKSDICRESRRTSSSSVLLTLRSGASSSSNDNSEEDTPGGSPKSNRSLVVTIALTALTAVTAAAKVGLLPGPLVALQDGQHFYAPYTDALIAHDVGSTLLTATLGYTFVQIVTWAASQGYLAARDSRKIIHTLSAPLFILFWPIFSDAAGARVFCVIVPMINAIRLYTAANGTGETSLAAAVSRSGDSQEAVGGPFIYVCILAACILLFWRDAPSGAGIVALSNLAAGDGLADLVGRRLGKNNKWPGLDKSVAGTIAFWVGATACSVGLLLWLQYTGSLVLQTAGLELVTTVAAISLVAALLELVPWADDNYTVPVAAGVLTMLFLH
jgi:dolichol kinase/type II secretory pathway pseudopilin PulG